MFMSEQQADQFKAQWIKIDEENAQQRIDNFLFARLKGVPKSHIYRMLRKGEVRVNRGRIQAQYRLHAGDLIRIPPLRLAVRENGIVPVALVKERLENRLIYEDDWFIALNKPSGMAVHGGSGLSFGVIEGLRLIRPKARFLELVHRLDRETSGCLLIAKKRSVLRILHELFRENGVDKRYLALLAGVWPRENAVVDAPLKKNVKQSGERMVRVAAGGKQAQTAFRRIARFAEATLVEAKPITGRTHQIRVHAASMGYPIAGDGRYGDEEKNRFYRQAGLRRLFLHAARLVFEHPISGDRVTIQAPLDTELEDCLHCLSTRTDHESN